MAVDARPRAVRPTDDANPDPRCVYIPNRIYTRGLLNRIYGLLQPIRREEAAAQRDVPTDLRDGVNYHVRFAVPAERMTAASETIAKAVTLPNDSPEIRVQQPKHLTPLKPE